jgi:DNA-binding SARP family transcriptional activator
MQAAGPAALLAVARDRAQDAARSHGHAAATTAGAAGEIFDLVPYPLMMVGRDRQVLRVNRAFAAGLGTPAPGTACCEVLGCGLEGTSWHGCLTDAVAGPDGRSGSHRTTRSFTGHDVVWISAGRFDADGERVVYRLARAAGGGSDEQPEDEAEPRLRICVLGSLDLRREGAARLDGEWLNQRPGRLLKFLVATRGRLVTSDEIAEALWPRYGSGSPSAVRHAVHLLRRRLEPERLVNTPSRFIVTSQGRYGLDAATVWIDADEFERTTRAGVDAFVNGGRDVAEQQLQQALALYRGDFLVDDLYEEWTIEERERLRSLINVPLRVLAEIRLGTGDLEGAAEFIERLSRLEPFDDDVHRLLVDIWLREGRASRAVRHFEAFRARLRREFGVEPSFDMADRYRRAGEPLHAL